jgi:hypothetical protein
MGEAIPPGYGLSRVALAMVYEVETCCRSDVHG